MMTILRAGLYERVSTEEQALHGYSIATQKANLTEYCEKNKIKIVDHYTDEGISGSKPPLKRPGLHRLLEDVKAGKIDIILFTKLDRWFRSVKEYYKVQEVLEAHKVDWKAILEDYDTSTANGRMTITIFLAIAQNERERTAERVKLVLANKRKNKEACFGGPFLPMGYKKEKDKDGVMRLVKDPETEQMTQEFWDILIKYNNLNKAIRHMSNVYGVTKNSKSWFRIARCEFYCGMYDGIDEYCEPYVSKKDWLHIQETAQQRKRDCTAKQIYLFSGMIKCPLCGHTLCGTYANKEYKNVGKVAYHSYRCRFKFTTCNYRRDLSEKRIEKYLLKNVRERIEGKIAEVELEKRQPKPKPKTNINALKERLRRLEIVYMAGNKPDAEYLAEQKEIKDLIAKAEDEAPPPEVNLEPLKEVLSVDFEEVYKTLDQEERRRFWRGIVKEIVFEDNKIIDVIFF